MPSFLKHPLLMKIIASLYLVLLLTLTHLPRLGPIPELPGKDKTLHFIAYFMAAIFCQTAFASPSHPHRKLFFIIAALLTMGALDEKTQPYVNRCCDLHDWFADAAGILVGSALYYYFLKKSRKTIIAS